MLTQVDENLAEMLNLFIKRDVLLGCGLEFLSQMQNDIIGAAGVPGVSTSLFRPMFGFGGNFRHSDRDIKIDIEKLDTRLIGAFLQS